MQNLFGQISQHLCRNSNDSEYSGQIDEFEIKLDAIFSEFMNVGHSVHVVHNLRDYGDTKKHISGATLLRLTLHEYVKERTVYLDGDTLVRGDVSELGSIDLEGQPIAVCRDPSIVRAWTAQKSKNPLYWRPGYSKLFSYLEKIGVSEPINYFNAGVLVLDLPSIREMDEINILADVQRASGYKLRDQDHLNAIFCENANCWTRNGIQSGGIRK